MVLKVLETKYYFCVPEIKVQQKDSDLKLNVAGTLLNFNQ